jgi:hypothetical protein
MACTGRETAAGAVIRLVATAKCLGQVQARPIPQWRGYLFIFLQRDVSFPSAPGYRFSALGERPDAGLACKELRDVRHSGPELDVGRTRNHPDRGCHLAVTTIGRLIAASSVNGLCHIMPESDAARFREEAEACRRQAEGAISPADKEAWLKMAGEWTKLAQNAEMQTTK